MLFVIYCRDKEGAEPIRLENREAHLAYEGCKQSESDEPGSAQPPSRSTTRRTWLRLKTGWCFGQAERASKLALILVGT